MTRTCVRTGSTGELGIEVLTLPYPAEPFTDCLGADLCGQDSWPDLAVLGEALMCSDPVELPPPEDPAQLCWYRWVVGHHAAFCVWRLLDHELERLTEGEGSIAQASMLYDVYSALFTYAGSCTPTQYAEVARARMKAKHPAFSGTWARDYERIPALTRQVNETYAPHTVAPLRKAARDNHLVHRALAMRLVPQGGSLLQDAGKAAEPTDTERDLLDELFLTVRGPSCPAAFAAQTVRRVTRIGRDLATHGLDSETYRGIGFTREQEDTVMRVEQSCAATVAGFGAWVARQSERTSAHA
ncbi:hypothetical protein ACL03H_01425 [Saccharopolyspora sp. MS10]|uniref:hypothetical protein n=1 Tax=Saccharopolyspora sp. MS10 TaxID=3385973 RepID=UPI00399F98AA